jgi:hypothetical protein
VATRRGLAWLLWAAAGQATLALCSRVPVPVGRASGPVSPVWARPLSPLSAHGAGGKFNSFSIFKNNSNLSENSKIHIKFISCSKIMKQVQLFI